MAPGLIDHLFRAEIRIDTTGGAAQVSVVGARGDVRKRPRFASSPRTPRGPRAGLTSRDRGDRRRCSVAVPAGTRRLGGGPSRRGRRGRSSPSAMAGGRSPGPLTSKIGSRRGEERLARSPAGAAGDGVEERQRLRAARAPLRRLPRSACRAAARTRPSTQLAGPARRPRRREPRPRPSSPAATAARTAQASSRASGGPALDRGGATERGQGLPARPSVQRRAAEVEPGPGVVRRRARSPSERVRALPPGGRAGRAPGRARARRPPRRGRPSARAPPDGARSSGGSPGRAGSKTSGAYSPSGPNRICSRATVASSQRSNLEPGEGALVGARVVAAARAPRRRARNDRRTCASANTSSPGVWLGDARPAHARRCGADARDDDALVEQIGAVERPQERRVAGRQRPPERRLGAGDVVRRGAAGGRGSGPPAGARARSGNDRRSRVSRSRRLRRASALRSLADERGRQRASRGGHRRPEPRRHAAALQPAAGGVALGPLAVDGRADVERQLGAGRARLADSDDARATVRRRRRERTTIERARDQGRGGRGAAQPGRRQRAEAGERLAPIAPASATRIPFWPRVATRTSSAASGPVSSPTIR